MTQKGAQNSLGGCTSLIYRGYHYIEKIICLNYWIGDIHDSTTDGDELCGSSNGPLQSILFKSE